MPVDRSIPMPGLMKDLPWHRGFPVPWFVGQVDGVYDFRVVKPGAIEEALNGRLCWVCGRKIGHKYGYVAGPMCAINRTSAEPPSHRACALYSALACPFLSRPHATRREAGLPTELAEVPGQMIARNPGAAMVWMNSGPVSIKPDGRGNYLFHLEDPEEVIWLAEGREATRFEVMESIESGLPLLKAAVGYDDLTDNEKAEADAELLERLEDTVKYLPAVA